MTVEVANYISQLNNAYPRNRDLIKEGDDHIRLTKAVLQSTFPGMNKAVTATSDKLNKLDASFVYEEESIKINNPLVMAAKKGMDFGENIVTGVGDPEEPTDAVNLRSLQGGLMWPVGSIFMTVDSRNPEDILGFGTWEKFAAGRVIVGTGTTTDINNETRTVVNEAKGGAYQVKLKDTNVPEHTHTATGKAASGGRHNHGFPAGGGSDGSGGRRAIAIDIGVNDGYDWIGERDGGIPAVNSGGDHEHDLTITVGAYGKGEAFDIAPPYIACNIWVRKPDATP
ncbi:MAG: phage baseplate protein [Plesiomonas sp.]